MIECVSAGRRALATAAWVLMLSVSGCNRQAAAPAASPTVANDAPAPAAPISKDAASSPAPFAWPASLRPFGEGFPQAGDPCRRLGETSAVANYLDHTRDLVGCPGAADSAPARALVTERNGKVVGEIEGVTLISLPTP